MKLVMVHGRSQEGKDPVALKKEWLDALAYGLARANEVLPVGTTVEFPFYGDLFAKLVKDIDTPLGANINAKGANPDIDQELRGAIIAEIAAGIGISDADVQRELAGQPIAKGPGNWAWTQAIMRAIDRIPGLNSKVIDTFTRDVYVYLSYPGVRAPIDHLVVKAMGNEPCVVVSHSLGTVVSYNVLYKGPASPPCPRFITLGSPLGINAIKGQIEIPLRSPPSVEHWFNAYDDRDMVALVALDRRNFDVTPPIENKNDVKNFTDNRHGITGYLSDPVVASKIVQFLR